MATNQTNTPISNEIQKLTKKELIEYVLAVHVLMSQRLLNTRGYKPTKFDIVDYDCDYDDDTISDCMEIVDIFKKMYPKVSI